MKEINYEFALEMQGARMERTNKRLFIIVLVLVISLVLTNSGWIWYSRQFKEETVTTTISAKQEADGDSKNMIIGGDYDAGNAECESDKDS